MDATFELTTDDHGLFTFTLKSVDGTPLLHGLKCPGRIPVGIDVVHVRKAVRDIRHFVPHLASDGAFVVLKDDKGQVLGKSPHVPKRALKALVTAIQDMAPIAGISEHRLPEPSSH